MGARLDGTSKPKTRPLLELFPENQKFKDDIQSKVEVKNVVYLVASQKLSENKELRFENVQLCTKKVTLQVSKSTFLKIMSHPP